MPTIEIIKHLLPRGRAWRLTVDRVLKKWISGIVYPAASGKTIADEAWAESHPLTTTHLPDWEHQFNLSGSGSDTVRRTSLDAAWKATGGQSPYYIQSIIQAAGFTNCYVHEWWEGSGPPYVRRDPRLYTTLPLIGTYQCTPTDQDGPQCCEQIDANGDAFDQPQCNAFLANYPGYLVNKRLTDEAPPPVPDDPTKWPFFIYIAGETFPDPAQIDMTRLSELEDLLLKICPTQNWIVLMVVGFDPGAAGFFQWDAGNGWDGSQWINT
jgi:hypothetical protein